LKLDTALLKPGMRLAVGVSGGADSVALLRALHACAAELGLVLHVAHMNHMLRGAESDADMEFVKELAAELKLTLHQAHTDIAVEAAGGLGKAAEGIEEAARRLRYHWFRQLMTEVPLDAVVTAHTLDDQAETVLGKFLRGAWTEGLSGIHPRVESPEGLILRPLLGVTRTEIEAYLRGLGQTWREDSSNRDTAFTRNRIRHELLPELEKWNPRLREHLANMAELARDEEAFLAAEAARLAALMTLPGRPVRGGGRAGTGAGAEGVALEIGQLAAQPVAMQRRILRFAAEKLGAAMDFAGTEALRALALTGAAGQRRELAGGLRAERSHRELRLAILALAEADAAPEPLELPVPGEVESAAFGLRVRIVGASADPATLRNWKPGDRVTLRHSSGPRKVKEVLERMKVTGAERALWPVVEWQGKIVWMQGVIVEAVAGMEILVEPRVAKSEP
jgi:tRNA(Ile)-lysidine synthase